MATIVKRILVLHGSPVYSQARNRDGEPILHEGSPVFVQSFPNATYLDITGSHNYGKAALSVLKSRFVDENGHITLEMPEEPAACPIDKATFDAAQATQEDYEEICQQINQSIEEYRDYDRVIREYNALVYCLTEKDQRLSPSILNSRAYYEGEGYDIAYLHDECPLDE